MIGSFYFEVAGRFSLKYVTEKSLEHYYEWKRSGKNI